MEKLLTLITSLYTALTNLWKAAYNLDPEDRQRSVRIAAGLGVLLVVLVLCGAGGAASQVVPAEHPAWEGVLQARLVLVRLALAVPLLILAAFAGVLIYQLLENTELGKRLLIWAPADDARTQAQKTRNAGSLLGAILAASIVGMLLGVLR